MKRYRIEIDGEVETLDCISVFVTCKGWTGGLESRIKEYVTDFITCPIDFWTEDWCGLHICFNLRSARDNRQRFIWFSEIFNFVATWQKLSY